MARTVESLVEDVRAVARERGYAVAVHGSRRRDLDLIAAPWTPEAVDPLDLVDAICFVLDLRQLAADDPRTAPTPEFKPFGRLAWGLVDALDQPLPISFIDLSVMPKAGTAFPDHVARGYTEQSARLSSREGGGA